MSLQRERIKEANRRLKMPVGPWLEIDLSTRPHPSWMTRAYENNRYIVMIIDNCPTNAGNAIRVMIQKVNDSPILNHWSELQKIKNELFGPETMAIEYYPKESELVNQHNIYWLWIFPDGVIPTMIK